MVCQKETSFWGPVKFVLSSQLVFKACRTSKKARPEVFEKLMATFVFMEITKKQGFQRRFGNKRSVVRGDRWRPISERCRPGHIAFLMTWRTRSVFGLEHRGPFKEKTRHEAIRPWKLATCGFLTGEKRRFDWLLKYDNDAINTKTRGWYQNVVHITNVSPYLKGLPWQMQDAIKRII